MPDAVDLAASIYVMPLGRRWSVVRVDEHEGLAAAVGETGPVMHDPAARSVYFLVPVDTEWDVAGTELLGETCYLAVPVPSVVEPPGPHWIRPPDGTLVDPADLARRLGPRLRADHFS